jgi:hypothetical protein
LKAERTKAKAKLMFTLLNEVGPKSLTHRFSYKNEITNYELRDISNAFCLPQPRTNGMKKLHRGLYVWNSLPKEIRDSKSLTCFERKIASHIV